MAITCAEAGKKGGLKTSETHGWEFYQAIGRKGGARRRELAEKGRKLEELEKASKV